MNKVWIIFLCCLTFLGCDPMNQSKFSGTLEVTEHALGVKVPGRIATLTVEEGDEVKAGQVLATLDRYEQVKKDHERSQNLLNEGGTSQQTLEYAALSLDDQQVISPIDGIVLVKVHEVGETVSAGAPVVVIGDRSKLWVKIFVPEGRINTIQVGQPARLSFDGVKEKFKGHVSFIAPRAEFTPRNVQTQEERITQAFAVKVTLDTPRDFLRPGVAADVVLESEDKHE
jgi:HlyD family secretion protein